jgi:cytosine/adenosine deaminase-related metal-dependent hydrolase
LVNAHAHLELTCYRGQLSPQPLWDWFFRLLAMRFAPGGAEREQAAVAAGAAESLAAGVTCVGDISRTGVHVAALRGSPIRKVCFLELISGAFAPPNDVPSLEAALRQAVEASHQPSAVPPAAAQSSRAGTHPSSFVLHPSSLPANRSSLITSHSSLLGLSPHALYTVTWDDLVGTAALARRHDLPVTIHVLETVEEAEWLARGGGYLEDFLQRCKLPTTGMHPTGGAIERLARAGLMDCRPLLAHVNYIDDAELSRLAATKASVAWCPRSHRFFGHAPHRWREMLAAGVNVCLGTDSLASNESLSILDELRYVRALVPDFPSDELLTMATIRGAIGLRLDGEIGSLERGKLADFIAIPWDARGPAAPAANLLDGAQRITGVWINGAALSVGR